MMAISVYDILARYTEKEDISYFRKLHNDLIYFLGNPSNAKEFAIALTYKGYLDNILNVSLEDDYYRNDIVDGTLRALRHSIDQIVKRQEELPESLNNLGDAVQKFSTFPQLRGYHVTVTGPSGPAKLFVAPFPNDMLYTAGGKTQRMFPNMDENLADPKFAKIISNWYVTSIIELRSQLKEKGETVDSICVIEKPYSATGALGLIPYITSKRKLSLPAAIIRIGYWNRSSKISGIRPRIGSEVCLLYDVAISGDALSEASSFLRDEFNVRVPACIIFFDFQQGAEERLRKEGTKLISYMKYSDIKEQLNRKLKFALKLGKLEDERQNYSEAELMSRVEKVTRGYFNQLRREPVK